MIQTSTGDGSVSPSQKFREYVYNVALPAFRGKDGMETAALKDDTIDRVGDHDALWFLYALETAVVIREGASFSAAHSGAKEQIFWEGLKTIAPRPITIWLEPVFTIGAAGRLSRNFGWPPERIGLQSKGNWAFDLMAYGNAEQAHIACEVKKTVREVDAMLEVMGSYLSEPPLIEEPAQPARRNAYRKVKGLREFRPAFFWAVGPEGYEKIFRVEYAAPDSPSIRLVPAGPEALLFQEDHGCIVLKVGAEGGSLTLYGRKSAHAWQYQCAMRDQTPIFVDEPSIETQSRIAMSWEGALELLDRYSWHRLFPLDVHPEFRERVINEIEGRTKEGELDHHKINVWRDVCGQSR